MQQQSPLNQLLPILDEAIKASPKRSEFLLTKANWLEQAYNQTKEQITLTEALSMLEQAKEYDPYNRSILMSQYRLLQENGQLEQSLQVLEEGISKFPWEIKMYELAFTSYTKASKTAIANNNVTAANQYEERILALSSEVQRRIDQLALLPEEQQQGRSFSFTPAMEQAIAELTIAKTN
jgi:tetratricopeptide (TPR) repeat protein